MSNVQRSGIPSPGNSGGVTITEVWSEAEYDAAVAAGDKLIVRMDLAGFTTTTTSTSTTAGPTTTSTTTTAGPTTTTTTAAPTTTTTTTTAAPTTTTTSTTTTTAEPTTTTTTTTSPPLDVTDNFDRANAALTTPWTVITGMSMPTIVGNAVFASAAGANGAIYTGETFADNQYAQGKMNWGGAAVADPAGGFRVRGSTSGNTGYLITRGSDPDGEVGYDLLSLSKSGVWIADYAVDGLQYFRIEVTGASPAVIRVYGKATSGAAWGSALPKVDGGATSHSDSSSPITSGSPGLHTTIRQVDVATSYIDDFAAGNL